MSLYGWLFLDMNAFFASVEQQEHPELRGRPVAVAPVLADSGCVIAPSYEAKLCGVKTGARVGEAKALCPNLRVIEANPHLYRLYHDAILETLGDCISGWRALSIDEMVCRLQANERELADALRLADLCKRRISEQVGEWLTCSIGISSNPFLAKVASELQKPNGRSVLLPEDLPHKVCKMKLCDWPGIAHGMEARLHTSGVTTTEQMYQLTKLAMVRIWGGIEGERWWGQIRGHEVARPDVIRRRIGHSHVLPPDYQTAAGVAAIARKLLEKAAERMRYEGYHARRLTVGVSQRSGGWSDTVKFEPAHDTWTLMGAFKQIWRETPDPRGVEVVLGDIVFDLDVPGSLFLNTEREAATSAVDAINRRYGRHTVMIASVLPAVRQAPDRIAFGNVAMRGDHFIHQSQLIPSTNPQIQARADSALPRRPVGPTPAEYDIHCM